ncbi:ComF family protein [Luteimonas sp. FCS-9]|uniref:ComF family protein n=1 Tax=Luteimonas sp. FCS-9 TaxID=1547516 RepID=UPI00063E9D6B|nr:ComF family protein [Luteimonas sp. FCS-9]KLI99884.1 competence protein ComF [Luteimonas sp. FCS-9]
MTQAVNLTTGPPVDERGPRCWLRRLFAARCLVCGERGDDGRALCAACAAALPWAGPACARCAVPLPAGDALCGACLRRPPPLDAAHAAFVYGFPVDRLLPRLKFHRDLAAGALLSASMARALASRPRPDALVPVPLHPARLRTRGYDQALELTRPLARALGLPLRTDLLRRRRATAPQSRLDAPARRRNVRGAFAATARGPLPAHVALVDDVMTTGATLHAAALALRRLGVARVDAWVCARVP